MTSQHFTVRRYQEGEHATCYKNGWTRMHTEVSLTARPFFDFHGFQFVADNQVVSSRVTLRNTLMEKRLKS